MALLVQMGDLLDDLQHTLAAQTACAGSKGAGAEFDDNALWLHTCQQVLIIRVAGKLCLSYRQIACAESADL